MIQDCVIHDYYEEIERAKQPGYVSRYDDFDFEYTDAPRSRPARFDQPHAHPAAEQPHIGAKATDTMQRTSRISRQAALVASDLRLQRTGRAEFPVRTRGTLSRTADGWQCFRRNR